MRTHLAQGCVSPSCCLRFQAKTIRCGRKKFGTLCLVLRVVTSAEPCHDAEHCITADCTRNSSYSSATLEEDYRRDGYILLEQFLPPDLLSELQEKTRAIERGVANRSLHDPLLDVVLDEDGSARLRRIEHPQHLDEVYDRVRTYGPLLDLLEPLLGGRGVRFDHGKLNFKPPRTHSSVEWHQDWAYVPHTNDDLCAVGVFLEGSTPENGPMMVVPGSHKGAVYSHHQDGMFVGAVDARDLAEILPRAVPLLAPAGSVSIHHTRLLHGSRNSARTSASTRPLLFYNYFAVDAFPVFHAVPWDEFNARILRGSPVSTPLLKELPMRIPRPTPAASDGQSTRSLYELQRDMRGAVNRES